MQNIFFYICPPKLDTQIVSFKYEAIPPSSKNVNMFNMLFKKNQVSNLDRKIFPVHKRLIKHIRILWEMCVKTQSASRSFLFGPSCIEQ